MDIRQLRYFVTTVEEGTISAAARKLHISQPPLSYQISLLEAEYGMKLFERGARQITLTEAGNLLYRYATQILELEQAADDDLKSLHLGKSGSIRLGLISSADSEELYKGLRLFHAAQPAVQFKIYEGNTYELLDQLRKGRIELAVIRTPFPSRGLDSITLTCDQMVVAGSKEQMADLLPLPNLTLKNLYQRPLIIYRRWEKIIRETFEQEGTQPDIFCVNDDARTSLEWAAAGLALTIVPASILHLMPQLPSRPLQEEALHSSICLVKINSRPSAKGAAPSLAAQALYQTFQAFAKPAFTKF